ncbi:FAD-binding oxidoreductase [Saccharopolyspora sp. NFXS83]|uniref:FAD-binding oxidoreductase n=1 Tax=Saccharopolyspora sp. NFXS83 TaxID=2993560 RepID=UPI00224AEBDF|nr:FAD-binding oxidoreductase [Saccharopolyspora sp. NFXS83]MCX2732220.1 FAD-binding oxidoreductase [Saccharopolyspora sp. NFXS83]
MPANTTNPAARAALESAAGTGEIRDATAADEVAGVRPTWVAAASGTDEVSAILRAAAEHELTVVPRGSGSKLDWGAAPRSADLLLDLSANSGIVEHAAGDLVLSARAGTPLATLHDTAAEADQQLPIDPPDRAATAGGVVATATSGPGRYFFGGVRDLLIGITVVLADGTVTTSGGKVVKNVAGYDLGKLYTGSFGTLGVITEVVFRLHPIAAEHRWISSTVDTAADAATIVDTYRHCQAMPTAIELDRPEPGGAITVSAQLEGRPAATHERAEALARDVGGTVHDRAPDWWGQHPFGPSDNALRLGAEPAALTTLLTATDRAATDTGLSPALRGAAGLGVLHAGLPAADDPRAVADLVAALRGRLDYAVLQRGTATVRDALDPWGPQPAGISSLMRRIKDRFDPGHRLAPGRFAGGI